MVEARKSPEALIKSLLAYIEQNCRGRVTLSDLEQISGLTRFSLIRLFAQVCGMTPIDYARARRLAQSIPMLLSGDSVLDVALASGFEYEQSYIRAFKEAYGVTPARFRRRQEPVPIAEIPSLSGFTASADGMLGRPKILARPAFSLRGRPSIYNYADNQLFGLPLLTGLSDDGGEIFVGASRASKESMFKHNYLVADPSGGAVWLWPAGQWAQFSYIGLHPLDEHGVQRQRLMLSMVAGMWMARRGLTWTDNYIERVRRDLLTGDYCEVDVECCLGEYSAGEEG